MCKLSVVVCLSFGRRYIADGFEQSVVVEPGHPCEGVLRPDPDLIDLTDIAAALSKLCRFGGHCRHFYSVAEPSVLASDLIQQFYPEDKTLAKWALLHDASEAYMVDIPRPVKRQLKEYVRLEDAIQETIARKFDLPWPTPKEVHEADGDMLTLEL